MTNQVDFLPEDYLEKKAQRRTNVVCLFLFLFVAVGVGGGFLYSQQRQSKLKDEVAQINARMLEASDALGQLEELENKKKQMMSKAKISAMLMEAVPRSLMLATITNDLPGRVSLLDYKMSTKEIVDKSSSKKSRNKKSKQAAKNKDAKKIVTPKKFETKIEFMGLAPTDMEVAALIANLNESTLFSQVNLVLSEEHQLKEGVVRRFKLLAILDQQARASSQDVEMARRKHIKGM